MELTLAIDTEALLIERPLLGLAPWLYPPASNARWPKLRAFLEYLNFPAYHFHTTNAVYRHEIDKFPLVNGLAGQLKKSYNITDDGEFAGLMRAMQFARDVGAGLHLITARPVHAYPTTGAFATQFGDYMKPFSIRSYISYMAEFIRYARQDERLPIQIVNLIDEPRWFFRNAADSPDGPYLGLISEAELLSLYPATWDFAYIFLDEQLTARGARSGINIQMLSDVYPVGSLAKPVDLPPCPPAPNDVVHLLTCPAVNSAANGICFVNYGGPDEADTIIRKALADMTKPGAVNRRIFFKDSGGTRVDNATDEQEFAFGIDSITSTMRAFRQGVDFCAQYFFLGAESPEPHAGMFASIWNGSDYAARRPLTPLALFSKTQSTGAYRMKDRVGAGIPGVDYLGLLSNRGTAKAYYTYYLVNRDDNAHNVTLTPARSRPLYRYWLNYDHDTGRTIRSQAIAAAATVRIPLPPRSMTALTEREVTNLNWPIRA